MTPHPKNWVEWVRQPYEDVITDPVNWAKKCLALGADLVCLRLESTDPPERTVQRMLRQRLLSAFLRQLTLRS